MSNPTTTGVKKYRGILKGKIEGNEPTPTGIEDSIEETAMKMHHITRDHEAETIAEATPPTTAGEEWTIDTIRKHLAEHIADDAEHGLVNLVDAINASLAAERATYVHQREDWIKEIQQLQQQLAAAKADADNWYRQYKAMKCAGDTELEIELEETKKQLAAERGETEPR
jgi:hypothetical protein